MAVENSNRDTTSKCYPDEDSRHGRTTDGGKKAASTSDGAVMAAANQCLHAADASISPGTVVLEAGRGRIDADGVPAKAMTLASGGLDAIARVLAAQLRPGDTADATNPKGRDCALESPIRDCQSPGSGPNQPSTNSTPSP